jgi:hypothetical protein
MRSFALKTHLDEPVVTGTSFDVYMPAVLATAKQVASEHWGRSGTDNGIAAL